jgi:hypothetical protein
MDLFEKKEGKVPMFGKTDREVQIWSMISDKPKWSRQTRRKLNARPRMIVRNVTYNYKIPKAEVS